MVKDWSCKAAFYARVEQFGLHGLDFQHVTLCERRAWLFLHNINFAQWHERVTVGLARHAVSYTRDHSVAGLIGLAPDRIDWKNRVVYEHKGTAGAVEASHNQTAFYAVMLSIATGQEWQAVTPILSTRRQRTVVLDEKRLQRLCEASARLAILAEQDDVPNAEKVTLCKTCSASVFCDYD